MSSRKDKTFLSVKLIKEIVGSVPQYGIGNTRPQLAWHCEIYPGWEREWSVRSGEREMQIIFCVSFCILRFNWVHSGLKLQFETAIVVSRRNVWNLFLNHLGVKIRTSPRCRLRQHFKGGEKLCSHFFWRSLDLAKSDWRSIGYPQFFDLPQPGSLFHCEAKWYEAACKEGHMTWQSVDDDVLQCADEEGKNKFRRFYSTIILH